MTLHPPEVQPADLNTEQQPEAELHPFIGKSDKMRSFSNLIATATLINSVLGGSIFLRQNQASTDPNDDAFYKTPANINSFAAGAVIDSRPVITTIAGRQSVQLKYRTTDNSGNAISTVATLWIPNNNVRLTPAVLAYSYAEDAVQLDCAPSWAYVAFSNSTNAAAAGFEGPNLIPHALDKGYHVVLADAEGPSSSWLVGNTEGRAVLDSVRATINFRNLNKASTSVGLYGYSGGAHSAVWAATLAGSYAPDLTIVGAAYGGTPVDLQSNFELLNDKSQATLAGAALFGLAQGYPALQTDYQTGADGLTEEGKKVQQQFQARKFCPNGNLSSFANTDWNKYFKKPVLQNPTLLNVLRRESLLSNVSSIGVPVPKFPRFQYHGLKDTTVPYDSELAYVQQQCATKQADIQFTTYPDADHVGAAGLGLGPAIRFLDLAFAGQTPKCTCGDACTF